MREDGGGDEVAEVETWLEAESSKFMAFHLCVYFGSYVRDPTLSKEF